MKIVNRILVSLFLVIFFICCGSVTKAPEPVVPTQTPVAEVVPEVVWREFGPESFFLSQAEKKIMLLYFYADGCSWCEKMKNTTFQDKCVRKELDKNYIVVAIERNHPITEKVLTLPVFPSIMVAIPDENGSILPEVFQGYVPPGHFCEFLKELDRQVDEALQ